MKKKILKMTIFIGITDTNYNYNMKEEHYIAKKRWSQLKKFDIM